jgi:exosome complex component CSL4
LSKRKAELAIPGDSLAVAEEFEAGSGTYADSDVVRAIQVGVPTFDMKKRTTIVKPVKSAALRIPQVGDYVTGLVESAQSTVVNVRILSINGIPSDDGFTGMAILRESRAFFGGSRGEDEGERIRSARDRETGRGERGFGRERRTGERPRRPATVCKTADIVRAKVISTLNSIIHLSFEDEKCGVLTAYCSNCGGAMVRVHDKAKCVECGNIEERKLASDFGRKAKIF